MEKHQDIELHAYLYNDQPKVWNGHKAGRISSWNILRIVSECSFATILEACGSHMRHVGVLPLRTDGRFLFSRKCFFGLHFKILCKVTNLKRCLQLFEKTKRQFLETTVHLNDTQSA